MIVNTFFMQGRGQPRAYRKSTTGNDIYRFFVSADTCVL
jgi:hypothetical protein